MPFPDECEFSKNPVHKFSQTSRRWAKLYYREGDLVAYTYRLQHLINGKWVTRVEITCEHDQIMYRTYDESGILLEENSRQVLLSPQDVVQSHPDSMREIKDRHVKWGEN